MIIVISSELLALWCSVCDKVTDVESDSVESIKSLLDFLLGDVVISSKNPNIACSKESESVASNNCSNSVIIAKVDDFVVSLDWDDTRERHLQMTSSLDGSLADCLWDGTILLNSLVIDFHWSISVQAVVSDSALIRRALEEERVAYSDIVPFS